MIEEMVALGFTSAEARVYLGLLSLPEATGYEIAKAAGLPRANVYAGLESLVSKEAAARVSGGDGPARFVAVPPADVLGRIKRRTARRVDGLIADLARVQSPREESSYTLRSAEAIIDRITVLADSARSTIGVSAWAVDLDWLARPLRTASQSGCRVVVNVFGDTDLDVGDVYRHERPERTVGGHTLTMVCDATTAVIATLGDHPSALCTTQPAVVQIVEKLMRDEAYLAAIYQDHHDVLERSYGPHLVQLRTRMLPTEQAKALTSIVGFGAADAELDLTAPDETIGGR